MLAKQCPEDAAAAALEKLAGVLEVQLEKTTERGARQGAEVRTGHSRSPHAGTAHGGPV